MNYLPSTQINHVIKHVIFDSILPAFSLKLNLYYSLRLMCLNAGVQCVMHLDMLDTIRQGLTFAI